MATLVASGYAPHTRTHTNTHTHFANPIISCLLGQVGLEMLQCCTAVPSLILITSCVTPPVTTLAHNSLKGFSAQCHEAAKRLPKGCHCVQELPIYCLTVPSIQSSLDNRLNLNNGSVPSYSHNVRHHI